MQFKLVALVRGAEGQLLASCLSAPFKLMSASAKRKRDERRNRASRASDDMLIYWPERFRRELC